MTITGAVHTVLDDNPGMEPSMAERIVTEATKFESLLSWPSGDSAVSHVLSVTRVELPTLRSHSSGPA
ncbi:hypothetical protein GCM10017674_78440 [Streptomyces gardneri]|uniref:Uncharacterized protein n=1 Tax=Streptomyces gardneri TaxID=66892 RepID=A0A4Y3RHA3_9ACTN|nr:hypothetical protein SGA01_27810 [Streptomyces gardneri]GHH22566.1 hypothetical protein GCM10017674_78440 [Streptomyces gardneri]